MMKTPACERGNDLIAFLYGEANEQEAQDFARHLDRCRDCRSEMASFGNVRESISVWKEEALVGFMSPQVVVPVRQKSALAAVREFFDLSPLWLKGAVAFASLLFCVMVILVLARSGEKRNPVTAATDKTYTKQEVDAILQKALSDQALTLATINSKKDQQEPVQNVKQRQNQPTFHPNGSTQSAKIRKPFSRSEREQLAADLRLLSTRDEDTLNLLGDRINQEF